MNLYQEVALSFKKVGDPWFRQTLSLRLPFINNIFVRMWIFRFTSFEKQVLYRHRLNSSNDLRMVVRNCVPRYDRIISEKQQKKVTRFVFNEE